MAQQDLPLPAMPRPVRLVDDPPVTEVRDPVEFRRMLGRALNLLTEASDVAPRLGTHDLAGATQDVLALLQLADAAAVALAREVDSRGLVRESTAGSLTQLVGRLASGEPVRALFPPGTSANSGPLVPVTDDPDATSAQSFSVRDSAGQTSASEPARPPTPGIEPAHAHRIAKVASACRERRNELVSQALRAGAVSVDCVHAALKQVDEVMPLLPRSTREKVLGSYLALPSDAGVRAVRELTKRVIATYATEESLDEADERLDAVESVTWSDLPNGMSRLVADLTAEHAARLRSAINALSAPAPCNDCCDQPHHRHTGEPTGEPDNRTPAKRRADALMLLAAWGSTAIDQDSSVLTRGPIQLVVTLDLEVLTGALRGFGVTDDGEALTAAQIRRMACDAEVVPIVLGGEGQPLDVGRRERLAGPAIRRAVVQRDRCCTFPGCGRPPSWCQVHHLVPWYAGGGTSVDNSTLLCQRHHTVVHRDQLAARLIDGQVVWDLTPGRMATAAAVSHVA